MLLEGRVRRVFVLRFLFLVLESALLVLKVITARGGQTCALAALPGPPVQVLPSNFMADHLRCIIQGGVDGHSVSEDAGAFRHLVIWKIGQDTKTKR